MNFEANLSKLNDCIRTTNELKSENVAMKTDLRALQARVDGQLTIINNLDIQGDLERESEILMTIGKSIAGNWQIYISQISLEFIG